MTEIISGITTHTTVGAKTFTTTLDTPGTYRIKALTGNGGNVYIGNDGTTTNYVTTATGYELVGGRDHIDVSVRHLGDLYLRVTNSGDGVCYHRLAGQLIGVYPPV
jgi:hypothetical protein